ncbi:MAG TPA: hypothetical protein VK021_05545 [Flavobacteriaceae bacterium]|nr:hypothetical protein [Flavobacteriaceae bacterium]
MTLYRYLITLLLGLLLISCNTDKKDKSTSTQAHNKIKLVSNDKYISDLPENAVFIGQNIDDFIGYVPSLYDVNKEKIQLEGADYDVFNVYEQDEKLFAVEPKFDNPDVVWRIWIYSPELKTEKEIGVDATLADIKSNYTIEHIGTEENLNIKVKNSSIAFIMDSSKLPENWWKNMDTEEIPDSLPVNKMIIQKPGSYLLIEKDKKSK